MLCVAVPREAAWGVWQSHVRLCEVCVAVPCEVVCGVWKSHVRLCWVCGSPH